ncbi:hypothetical protein HK098_008320 [Nowakowskiella sp. JEL0407]|nr:hypothetical protein HK098_008320 [Nowakowskiella sp. JEL0407]
MEDRTRLNPYGSYQITENSIQMEQIKKFCNSLGIAPVQYPITNTTPLSPPISPPLQVVPGSAQTSPVSTTRSLVGSPYERPTSPTKSKKAGQSVSLWKHYQQYCPLKPYGSAVRHYLEPLHTFLNENPDLVPSPQFQSEVAGIVSKIPESDRILWRVWEPETSLNADFAVMFKMMKVRVGNLNNPKVFQMAIEFKKLSESGADVRQKFVAASLIDVGQALSPSTSQSSIHSNVLDGELSFIYDDEPQTQPVFVGSTGSIPRPTSSWLSYLSNSTQVADFVDLSLVSKGDHAKDKVQVANAKKLAVYWWKYLDVRRFINLCKSCEADAKGNFDRDELLDKILRHIATHFAEETVEIKVEIAAEDNTDDKEESGDSVESELETKFAGLTITKPEREESDLSRSPIIKAVGNLSEAFYTTIKTVRKAVSQRFSIRSSKEIADVNRTGVAKTGHMIDEMIRTGLLTTDHVADALERVLEFADTLDDEESETYAEKDMVPGVWYLITLLISKKRISVENTKIVKV